MSERNCWVAVWVQAPLWAQQCRAPSHHSFQESPFLWVCFCKQQCSGSRTLQKGFAPGWQWSFRTRDSVFGIHFHTGWGELDEQWNELELLCTGWYSTSPAVLHLCAAPQEVWAPKVTAVGWDGEDGVNLLKSNLMTHERSDIRRDGEEDLCWEGSDQLHSHLLHCMEREKVRQKGVSSLF